MRLRDFTAAFFLFLASCGAAWAQENSDNLSFSLEKVEYFSKNSNPDSLIFYAKKAQDILDNKNIEKEEGISGVLNLLIAESYELKKEYEKSIVHYTQAGHELGKTKKADKLIASTNCFYRCARVYEKIGNLEEAIRNVNKSIKTKEIIIRGIDENNMISFLQGQIDYLEAKKQRWMDELEQKIQQEDLDLAAVNNKININLSVANYDVAILYLNKTEDLLEKMEQNKEIQVYKMKLFNFSTELYLEIYERTKDPKNLILAELLNKKVFEIDKQNYKDAENSIYSKEEIEKDKGFEKERSYNNLSRIIFSD